MTAPIAKPRTHRLDFFILLSLAALIIFLLTGCATTSAPTPDPGASAAVVQTPESSSIPETEPTTDSRIKAFSEIATYDDGVSVSVSQPVEFTPTNLDYMPIGEGETAVVFKLVLTNNSPDVLEPMAAVNVNSGGKAATYIADIGNNEYPDLGMFPMASVLPGQTVEWHLGYGVADPANITLDVAPDFSYDNMIFTNSAS